MKRGTVSLLAIMTALLSYWLSPSGLPAQGSQPLEERIARTDWAQIRGVNFIPSYASNTYEIWRHYDRDIFDRELRLAAAVGYNSVRLWLNYAVFAELGPKMVDRVEDALRLCAKHRLRAVIVLFDSCGVRPRKDARWMTASEAYDHFMYSPRLTEEEKLLLRQLFANYAKGFGKHTLVPVGADSPIMAILWQNWQSTPGNDKLGPEWYPKLEVYVNALLGRLKDHSSVLLWDLMNEPEFASEGPLTATVLIKPEMEKVRDEFLRHFHQHLKRRYPEEIVSIGWARLADCQQYADLADVLTFHVYRGPEELQQMIQQAHEISKGSGKQILITETLANWDFGSPGFGSLASDEQQLAHYQKVLPVLMKSPIGWMAWGFVVSRVFDPFCDIFYPDGHPRPAAIYLEKTLKSGGKPE